MDQKPTAEAATGSASGNATGDPTEPSASAVGPLRSAIIARTTAELVAQLNQPLAPGLYLVATPIGHLADLTLRAIATLANCDVIYCEDTRHSLKLTAHYGITTRLEPYHEHNAVQARPRILAALGRGKRVALISDAGTPLVSDPGYKLVRDALDGGHRVSALPGASAVLTALTASGLPTDSFFFAGFLPPKQAARRTRLEALRDVPGTLVCFEAPQRVAGLLADVAAVLGDRPAVLARELTKLHETLASGSASELAASSLAEEVRGECVVLIGPGQPADITDAVLEAELAKAFETLSQSAATKHVAQVLGVPRGRVYALALDLKARQVSASKSIEKASP